MTWSRRTWAREAADDVVGRLRVVGVHEAFEALCREIGAKPADVALAWLLRDPVVATVLVGARSVEQLQGNLGGPEVLEPAAGERHDQANMASIDR